MYRYSTQKKQSWFSCGCLTISMSGYLAVQVSDVRPEKEFVSNGLDSNSFQTGGIHCTMRAEKLLYALHMHLLNMFLIFNYLARQPPDELHHHLTQPAFSFLDFAPAPCVIFSNATLRRQTLCALMRHDVIAPFDLPHHLNSHKHSFSQKYVHSSRGQHFIRPRYR
jgi:hypothetical protein